MQWQRDTKFVLQQTVDVIVGALPYRSRFVLWTDELRKDLRLLWRRTPSAASAIAVRARRRGIQKFGNTQGGGGFTYILDRHAWANFQAHAALPFFDRRAAMDHLACWCAQWTSIDRGTTGVEEVGWRVHLKLCASLLPGCRCSPAPCRPHSRPPLPSLSSRPDPWLRACTLQVHTLLAYRLLRRMA